MSDAITFRRATEADIDAVLKIEYAAFSHPWTRGIFLDSLKSVSYTHLTLPTNREV